MGALRREGHALLGPQETFDEEEAPAKTRREFGNELRRSLGPFKVRCRTWERKEGGVESSFIESLLTSSGERVG